MKRLVFFAGPLIGLCALSACSPSANKQNPRDRSGAVDGDVTWRAVAQADGHAAFLSRPGTAPDLVLWCRNNRQITLRAHVFKAPSQNPDLRLSTKSGSVLFGGVRRQGGVRDGDRILVEGTAPLNDPKIIPFLQAVGDLTLTSGAETYRAVGADPDAIMGGFLVACQNLSTDNTQTKVAKETP